MRNREKELSVSTSETVGKTSGSSESTAVSHTVSHASAESKAAVQEVQRAPVQRFRVADVSASVWANTIEYKGKPVTLHSVSFERSYEDKKTKDRKYTKSFQPDDLGALLECVQRASQYLQGLKQPAKEPLPDQAE